MSDMNQVSNSGGAAAGPPSSSPPPRVPRVGVILLVVGVGLLMLIAGVKWGAARGGRNAADSGGEMAATSQPGQEKAEYYTCGMHPWIILPKPGNCPICHMALMPMAAAAFTGEIAMSPVITQNIGVRIAPVTVGEVVRTIRTVGAVDYNETLVRDVNLKISGWVEKLYVDRIGMPVKKGSPLLDIYSPELYSAREEYLQAYRHSAAFDGRAASMPANEATKWNAELLAAARKRLEYFDISDAQIDEMEKTEKITKTLRLTSPYDGLVIGKSVFQGAKVQAGEQLYRIADLSSVWVLATLYEYQLPYVQTGQEAVMSLPYLPGQTFKGKVIYIYPYVNPESRQVKVRLEVDNADMLLKPGMFANVELRSTLAKDRILVPREAVMDTGDRQVVFISVGGGKFLPRSVRVGVEAQDGMVEIVDGLSADDKVVVSGQFLLDSETRLREGMAKMVEGTLAGKQTSMPATSPAGAADLAGLPPEMAERIVELMDSYFAIGSALSHDTTDGIATPAEKIADNADALVKIELPDSPHFWHMHTETAGIHDKAKKLAQAKDIASARQAFADLGIGVGKLLKATGVPSTYGKEVRELHCPMYRDKQGGTWWLQPAGDVRNPYYGRSMLECFDKQNTIPVTRVQTAGGDKK